MAGNRAASPDSLRARREAVIEVLSRHFAADTLDLDQFDHRVDLAHRAGRVADLDALVADLEPAEERQTTALAWNKLSPAEQHALIATRPAKKYVVSILGGTERRGSWRVPKKMIVWAVMGGSTLDFREAHLPPGVTEVSVTAILGGVEIIVPPALAVECDGIAVMGGFDELHRSPIVPDPRDPLLRITGRVLMGGLEIETRLPGESRREARRRMRRERRALRKQERKQLPGG